MTKPSQTSMADQLRFIRNLIVVSVAAVIIIGVVFFMSSRSTDQDFAEQRRTARIGACAQAQADSHREVDSAGALAKSFADVATASITRTPELQAQIDAFVEAQRMVAATANPLRDCSTAGIDAYYDNAPPAEPCSNGGNGKGYCK